MRNLTVSGQIPMTGVPDDRPDAAINFPIWPSADLEAKKAVLANIPKAFGRDTPTFVIVWNLFLEQFVAAQAALAAMLERNTDEGTVKLKREWGMRKVKTVEQFELQGIRFPVGSEDITDENIPEILKMITDEIKSVELGRLTTKKSELFWTKAVKILFVVPQLMMFMLAIHMDPSRSFLFGIILILAAIALPNVYQTVARPVIECLAALCGKPSERFGEASLKTWGILVQFLMFMSGFIAIVVCAAILDATVIFMATQYDSFGQKDPAAIPFSTAVAIAGSFTGFLALASLAIARLEREQADIVRMVEDKIATVIVKVAPSLKQLRETESKLAVEQIREAEVFASARYQWIRLLTAIYLMTKSVPDEAIVRLIMMPHSPFEATSNDCGGDGTVATPQGFGARIRQVLGRPSSTDVSGG